MKYKLLLVLLIITATVSIEVIADDNISQSTDKSATNEKPNNEKCCVTVGYHQGGGSFFGADLEFLVSPRIGTQIGAGYLGFSA